MRRALSLAGIVAASAGPWRLQSRRLRDQHGQRQGAVRGQVLVVPRARTRRRHRRRRPQPRPGVPARPQGRLRREHVRGPRPRADPAPGHQPADRPRDASARPVMPAGLVTGEDAEDVAAYVASAAGKPGEDTGALAEVGGGPEGTAEAENGVLEIPAAPSGALYFVFADATAPAGQIKLESPNEASVDHNIAARGQRRQRGGPGRQQRRGLGGRRRPRARRVHLLLLGRGPPRGRHGRQAHGGVSRASRSRRSSRSASCAAR